MTFNINSALTDMMSAMKGKLDGDWDSVKFTVHQFLERDKLRFKLLADLRISNSIPEVTFEARLTSEKFVIEGELNAVEVVTKAVAQNAANAAINALKMAVSLALL